MARSLRVWMIKNRALVLVLAGLLIPYNQHELKSIILRLAKETPITSFTPSQPWLLIPVYRIVRLRRANLGFWLWLGGMLLRYFQLVSAPADWHVIRIGGTSIPWYTAAHLSLMVSISVIVAADTLEPGQSRIPLHQPKVEIRRLKDITLVSSPAFGPLWLNKKIQLWLNDVKFILNTHMPGLANAWTNISHTHYESLLLLGVVASWVGLLLLLYTFWYHYEQLSSWGLFGFFLAKFIIDIVRSNFLDGFHQLSFFEQIMFHQALRIDGVYYELSRTGWLANSTTLRCSSVNGGENKDQTSSSRIIFSENHIGCTFMTRQEILQIGTELIKTSPGYDLLAYNCTFLRYNLFMRIKHNDPAKQNNPFIQRNPTSRQIPHDSSLSHIAARLLTILAPSPLTHSVGSDYSSLVSKTFWFTIELMMLSHQIRAVVFLSSTVFGRVYRSRLILPVAIGVLLLQYAYQSLNDGRLMGPNSAHAVYTHATTAMRNHILGPMMAVYALAYWPATLLFPPDRMGRFDDSFEVLSDEQDPDILGSSTHTSSRAPSSAQATATTDYSLSRRGGPKVGRVRILTDFGDRLPGEISEEDLGPSVWEIGKMVISLGSAILIYKALWK